MALPAARGWVGGRMGYADGKYHFVGGVTSGWGDSDSHARSNRNDQFDPVTNTWTQKANFPYYVSTHCMNGNGNIIYLFGGGARSVATSGYPNLYITALYYYDPDTNFWGQFLVSGDIPSQPLRYSMTQLGGNLYLFSGMGESPRKITLNYGAGTGVSAALNPSGFDFEGEFYSTAQMVAAPANDGNIYVFQAGDPRFVRYNPTTNTAVEVASIPSDLSGSIGGPPTLTRVGNQLHLHGGTDMSGDYAQWVQQWIYDPSIDTWTQSESSPVGFSAHAACMIVERETLLVAGGQNFPVSTTYRTHTYEAERPPIDAPAMSLVGDSMMSLYPMLYGTFLGDSEVTFEPESVFGSNAAPGIRATGIPI